MPQKSYEEQIRNKLCEKMLGILEGHSFGDYKPSPEVFKTLSQAYEAMFGKYQSEPYNSDPNEAEIAQSTEPSEVAVEPVLSVRSRKTTKR